MNIATKISLALFAVSSSMVAVFYFWQRPLLIEDFRSMQESKTILNIERSRDAVLQELESLGKQTKDWGCWDDTYDYVQNHTPKFATVNLSDDLFETTQYDLITIVDGKGQVVFSRCRLPNGTISESIEGFDPVPLAMGTRSKPGPAVKSGPQIRGVESLDGTPALLCVQHITDGSGTQPTRGALVVGRFLTPMAVAQISGSVKVPFTILHPNEVPTAWADRVEKVRSDIALDQPVVGKPTIGIASLKDPSGSSLTAIRTQTVPDVLEQGTDTVNRVTASIILSSFLLSLMGLLFIRKTVSGPLEHLAGQVAAIEDESLHASGIGLLVKGRNDEIGTVGRSFEDMIRRLEEARTHLIRASREAGIADVARNVLHNAGNVLTPLTFSISQVEKLAEQANESGLRKALALIRGRAGSLDAYLAEDPKGSKLLYYLESLASKMESDRNELASEIGAIASSVSHLETIVRSQAANAAIPEHVYTFRLRDVVEELSTLMSSSLELNGVLMECHVDASLCSTGNPSKMLQILVNIVTNAVDALKARGPENRCITLTVGTTAEGDLEIRIGDNGIGIAAGELEKIFAPAYSTKDTGTGIGLHYCANTATEMGWELAAESEGLGKGATFVLVKRAGARKEFAA